MPSLGEVITLTNPNFRVMLTSSFEDTLMTEQELILVITIKSKNAFIPSPTLNMAKFTDLCLTYIYRGFFKIVQKIFTYLKQLSINLT